MRLSSSNVAVIAVFIVAVIAVLYFAGDSLAPTDDEVSEATEEAVVDDPLAERKANIPFRPVEDIIDADLIVTNFSAAGTGNLPIETSVPVACTIVYGTTEEFGQLSVDLDMDGGTHSVHNPLLSGLESETTYFFRVQGVDDAGNIYLSDTMTFTTPNFDEFTSDNLLSPQNGAEVIGVSSNFGDQANDGNWGILNAFDDNDSTAWSSNGDGDDAWFEVDLGGTFAISEIGFWTRTMSNDTAQIFEFTITNQDGDVFGPYELPDADQPYTFDVEIVAETVRFDVVSSNGGNTGAVEITMMGQAAEE